MNKLLLFFILALLLPARMAAAETEICDARLAGNRYYGAFYTLLKVGKLQPEHLAAAVQSHEPYNPFTSVTPGTIDAAAKRFFAEAVLDPEVLEKWNETKQLLAKLKLEVDAEGAIEKGAAFETRMTLAPTEVNRILHPMNGAKWAELPDGQVAIAYVATNTLGNHEIVVVTPEGAELHRAPFPVNSSKTKNWTIEWHKDQMNTQWLYLATTEITDDQPKIVVYRLSWTTKTLGHVWEMNGFMSPRYFRSVGNRFMILVTFNSITLDVADPDLVYDIPGTMIESKQGLAVGLDGKLLKTNKENTSSIATTAAGVPYIVSDNSGWMHVKWTDELGPHEITYSDAMGASTVAATVTDGGRLLAAKEGTVAGGQQAVAIHSPFESKTPILTVNLDGNRVPQINMQWFADAQRNPILGCITSESLHLIEVETQNHIKIPSPGTFVSWFSTKSQTYLLTQHNGARSIHKMFLEVGR